MSQLGSLHPSFGNPTSQHVGDGQILFVQGDPVDGIYEVEWGFFRLTAHTVDGHDVAVGTAKRGDLIVESALFSDTFHCTAVAIADSQVWIHDKSLFLDTLRGDRELSEKFMAALADQVRLLRSRLEICNIRSARKRVIQHVLTNREADGRTLHYEGYLKDLAFELGLTHETLYRTLAELEKEGVIERTPNAITLRKLPAA
jgi:CRP-like cAMP-binding protein